MRRALVLVPLLLAGACSGGGSGPASADKAAYLSKAEAICAKAVKAKDALQKQKPTSTAQFGTYVHGIVTVAADSTTALLALTPPAADSKKLHAEVLDPLSQQLAKARTFDTAVAAAVKAGDQVALVKLLQDPPTKTTANLAFMRTYGFKECVKAADTGS